MKVLVTGGAGFIGSNLSMRCYDNGWQTTLVDRDVSRMSAWRHNQYENIEVWNSDYSEPNILQLIKSSKFDVIMHQAAVPRVSYSVEHPAETNEENVGKLVRLLEAATGNCHRFVFASSSSVYGNAETLPLSEALPMNPISPYALQKKIGEEYIRMFCSLYGLDAICLRYFNVFGPYQYGDSAYSTAMSAWCHRVKHGLPLRSDGTGEQSRDLCVTGDTLITMSDLSHKKAKEIVAGDMVLSFDEKPYNKKRLFRISPVAKTHNYTPQQMYVIRFKNGNIIKCTPEHPWLTNRGFKSTQHLFRSLCSKGKCLKVKSIVPNDTRWHDYHQSIDKHQYDLGYIAGSLDGDGTYGKYKDSRNGNQIYVCSLRVTDKEFADYFDASCLHHGIACHRSKYQPEYPGSKLMYAVRTNKRSSYEFTTSLLSDQRFDNQDFCKGYIASIYDGEGDTYDGYILRMSNSDDRILANIYRILDRFGFLYSIMSRKTDDVRIVSILGGMMEHIRFFHLFQPKIKRKWPNIDRREVKTHQNEIIEIQAIEPEPVYTIEVEGTHTYVANDILCHNCYVDNVVSANMLAAASPKKFSGEACNIACGDRTSNNEILSKMKARFPNLQVEHAPFRAGDIMHTQADISRAKELIGYEPVVRFWDGFERTLKWWGL